MLDQPFDDLAMDGAADDASPRQIWLCADDYGLSAGVNGAIRDLVTRRRLNATSVMVVAPSFHRSEANALAALNREEKRVAIGLHVTLTAPLHPLSDAYKPLRDGAFLPLAETLMRAVLRRLDGEALAREITAQLKMFAHIFGRAPDFIDGHQHVHLFPGVREAVLAAAKANAPGAWLRQCGRAAAPRFSFADRKAWLLDYLSRDFRARAEALGLYTNAGFAGAYEFRDDADIAALFAGFLDSVPDDGLIMCHPGFVDAELQRLDPLTTLREREYAFLASDEFPKLLARQGVTLASPQAGMGAGSP